MIFVCLAYEAVQQHTAGFLGFQVALVLVAIQNTIFILDTNIVYEPLGGIKQTRWAAGMYLFCVLFISSIKITATIYVVRFGVGAPWTLTPSPIEGFVIGRMVDIVWMFFNAILPLFIAWFRSTQDEYLKIEITSEEPSYIESGTEETTSLHAGGKDRTGATYEAVVSI